MKQKSIALTERLWRELSAESREVGISMAEYLRRVLEDGDTVTARERLSRLSTIGHRSAKAVA